MIKTFSAGWVLLALCISGVGGCATLPDSWSSFAPISDTQSEPAVQPFPFVEVLPDIGTAPVIQPQLMVKQKPDLWAKIRAEFRLDHHLARRAVKQEIRWLRRHPKYFERLAERLQTYQPLITEAILEQGWPGEMALMPLIESALNPYALSPDGASGLWQFMPATGTRFGLQRDWWQDARRDPTQSTQAALKYLNFLHSRFDDWLLVAAAYNAGEGKVGRALRKAQRKHGKSVDFFDLRLPRETRSYVPRLLAVAQVVAHPEKYNVQLPRLVDEHHYVAVDTTSQIDLGVAARTIGVTEEQLYRWNPALRQWATPPSGPHRLNVPRSIATTAQAALNDLPAEERLKWLRIKVRSGDTLSGLARRYGSTVATIQRSNNLRGNLIRAGSVLLIPNGEAAHHPEQVFGVATLDYTVRKGDSLWAIARRFDVTQQEILRLNDLNRKRLLRIGQTLRIPNAQSVSQSDRRAVAYQVRRGDSLARIAGKFQVSVTDIASWNQLDAKNYIHPGQRLTLFVSAAD